VGTKRRRVAQSALTVPFRPPLVVTRTDILRHSSTSPKSKPGAIALRVAEETTASACEYRAVRKYYLRPIP
jgi:hypothetical protein